MEGGRRARPAPPGLRQQARPGAGSSFERTLDQLQQTFGAGIAPLELPIGEEAAFRGVADLLSDTAITYEAGQPTTGSIPDDMEAREHAVHESLVEGIVVADDELMERYLEGDIPSVEELEKTLAHGVASATVFPVVCGSAPKDIAVDRLATFICEIGPAPTERPPVVVRAGDHDAEISTDPDGQPLAVVFKTLADPYVGKISLFKVLSGTVRPDAVLTNPRTHADEKLHGLFTLRGKEQDQVNEVPAGDIARGRQARRRDHRRHPGAPKGTPVVVPLPQPPSRSCPSPSARSPRATRTS